MTRAWLGHDQGMKVKIVAMFSLWGVWMRLCKIESPHFVRYDIVTVPPNQIIIIIKLLFSKLNWIEITKN